jgi:hypothetical protein
MIALGVRGPQLPDLGAAAARYGAMANTLLQQRAAERQSAQSQQAMEIARNQEQRAASQHEIEQAGRQIEYYTLRAGQTMNRAGYEQFLGQLDRDAPEIAAQFRTNLPPENFNREELLRMVGSISDNFSRTFAPLNTEVVQGTDGKFRIIRRGGFEPAGAYEVPEYDLAPADTGGGVGGPDPEQRDPAASPTGLNARPGETPGQIKGRGIPAENVPTGSPLVRPMEETAPELTPASAGGGMGGVQPLDMQTAPLIIQNAVQNRVIDQTHMQQLREMVGPENERNLAAWMQQHQIRIQPPGEAPIQPGMRSAEYRPGVDAAPQFQQVQNAPSGMTYRPTGRAATGRPPLVSPSQDPGTAGAVAAATREPVGVSVERAGGTTRAERQAQVETEGPITASRERAERLERLREAAPKARSDVDSFLSDGARRINAIDRMLRTRSYESVVGMIEGRIPRILQDEGRSVAQRQLDEIVNTDVIRDIIASRAQTETGGSPLGNVSNSDLQMYVNAANALAQTGDENSFRRELLRMRDQIYRGMERARRTYSDTFRDLGGEMRGRELTAPTVSPRYTPAAPRGATGGNRPAAPRRTRGGAVVTNW